MWDPSDVWNVSFTRYLESTTGFLFGLGSRPPLWCRLVDTCLSGEMARRRREKADRVDFCGARFLVSVPADGSSVYV